MWEKFFSLCTFLYIFCIYENALIEKDVVDVSPKDCQVFHRTQEVGVGGVRVRVSLTHRASCKHGIHSNSQNKKDRVGVEASRLRTDSRGALLEDRPWREAQLGRCGSVTWKTGTPV